MTDTHQSGEEMGGGKGGEGRGEGRGREVKRGEEGEGRGGEREGKEGWGGEDRKKGNSLFLNFKLATLFKPRYSLYDTVN